MRDTQIVIVTGLSGSGKSVAIKCFEDLGFYCIDNLPTVLLPTFAELCAHAEDIRRIRASQGVAAKIRFHGGAGHGGRAGAAAPSLVERPLP